MKVSYNWLKEYVKNLPKPEKLADLLTMHSFEVKGIKKLGNDFILDIDVLPNRAHDCLCHLGVASECVALLSSKLKIQKSKIKEDKKIKASDFIKIEIKETDLCPRYCARVITDIKVGPSPKWLKEKLEAIGQQAINNIVDATNYVMLETGQPFHVFDYEKVEGRKIIVRRAKTGEKITTLDGENYELDNNILVIADSCEPLAIAGIKGGKKAEITNKTKDIVLESANFNLNNIHTSSRKLGLQTEASLRFEHGLDPNLASEAIDRVASLICKIAGGKVAKNIVDVYPFKLKPRKISLKVGEINSILGVEIPEREILHIFSSLGFKTRIIPPIKELINLAKSLIGRPYKYGASTSQEAPELFDCSSFTRYLFRQIGVEIPRPSIEQIEFGKNIDKKELEPGDLLFSKGSGQPHKNKKWPQGVGHVGVYIGNNEVIHASSKSGKVAKIRFRDFLKSSPFRGARRILGDKDDALLVEIPTRRMDIEIPEDLIEEIGRIYGYEKIPSRPPLGILVPAKVDDLLRLKNKVKDILGGLGLSEVYNYSFIGEEDLKILGAIPENYLELENPLSLDLQYLRRDLLTNLLKNIRDNFRYFSARGGEVRLFELGKIYFKNPKLSEKMILTGVLGKKDGGDGLFYEAKGIVDGLLNKLGISDQWYDDFEATPDWSNRKFWQFSRSAEIKLDNQEIGFVGEINPEILSKLKIKGGVAAFDIDFELLTRLVEEELIYQHPSKYPAVVRDIAVLVNPEDRVNDVLNVIETAGGELISDVDLFDMYEGDEIPEGKKNLAFHIIYQSDERTLTDKEVDEIHNRITKEISRRGWEVRK